MTLNLSPSPAKFGLLGIISLVPQAGLCRPDRLAAAFQATPNTAELRWSGERLVASAFQHAEDACLDPGTYDLPVQRAEKCEGVVYGSFFTGLDGTAGSDPITSMSEASVSLYAQGGLKAMTQLNGAWVSAIWDDRRQQAVFCRHDRGVETLYVAVRGSNVTFASDLQALRHSDVITELDEQGLAEFLHFLYIPAPRTAYREVHAVLPGYALIVDRQGIRHERFAPPVFVRGHRLSEQETLESAISSCLPKFSALFAEAIADSLPRHGKVALLLSGGKDSTALAIAASQVCPDRVVAFTVATRDPEFDESGRAAELCKHLGLPHRVFLPDEEDLVPGLNELAACQDQPCGDTASLPLWLCLRQLPDEVSTIWDANGNDHYFGHVAPIVDLAYARRVRLQSRLPKWAWLALLACMRLGPARFRSQAKKWARPIEDTFISWDGWTHEELSQLLGHNVSLDDTVPWRLMKESTDGDHRALRTEILGGIWGTHASLRKTVHLAHHAGRAVRFPFLDHRLARFVNDLPQEVKFSPNTNKILLRAYLARNLPSELAERQKAYFYFDLNLVLQHLQHGEDPWLRSLARSGLLKVVPAWSDEAIDRAMARYWKHPDQVKDRMYALCLLALWTATTDNTRMEA